MESAQGSSLAPGLFNGARVLVTGGRSGIGAAIARRFVELGATVTATGRTPRDDNDPDDVGEIVALDVRDREAVEELLASLPGLDVLVCSAGTIRRDDEFGLDAFADVVDVNLTGTMRTCTAARPLLAASRGSVVTIASMLTFVGGPHAPAYSASKAGVAALTRSLAVAWAPAGIRVNAIAPGWVATPINASLRADPDTYARVVDRTPMHRWGVPAEIAEMACFLASPGAGFITGATIPVDGGYLAS